MGTRRKGREIALQALYRLEITGDESGEGFELLWKHFEAPAEARRFAMELIRGVIEQRDRIDRLVADALENWNLARVSRVDLNVLRIAIYELLERREIPTSVVLNEAIEIARRFGSEESPKFVNGLLDAIAGLLGVRESHPGDSGIP